MTTKQPKHPSLAVRRRLFNKYKREALQAGERWEIEFDEMPEWPAVCPVHGVPLDYHRTKRLNEAAIGCFRNDAGFVKGSVAVMSLHALHYLWCRRYIAGAPRWDRSVCCLPTAPDFDERILAPL